MIIGVHSPEFEFEKSAKNVAEAIADFKLTYPIVQDNDFKTWRAYSNLYWPAKYLIDKDGKIRYTHFGEGDYDITEKMIQRLLSETGVSISGEISSAEGAPNYSRTPELYLGFKQIKSPSIQEKILPNQEKTYSVTNPVRTNTVGFAGVWVFTSEYAEASKGSKLLLNFESKEVFLVMRKSGSNASVSVKLDGEPLSLSEVGEDITNGVVVVSEDRLYKVINLPDASRGLLELEFLEDGIQVFAFTFG